MLNIDIQRVHRYATAQKERERLSSLNWIFVNIIFQHMVNIEYENRTLQQPQIMYFQIETMFQFDCLTVAVFSSCDVAIFSVCRSGKKKEKNICERERANSSIYFYILSKNNNLLLGKCIVSIHRITQYTHYIHTLPHYLQNANASIATRCNMYLCERW